MLLTTLQDSKRIESLHPLFARLFDYVKTHDLLNMPIGRIELDGDNLFINNVEAQCVSAEQQVLEVHREYIDVHILLQGEETIGWKPLADCTNETKPYDAESECALYTESASTYLTLKPGQCLIVWPEEPHAPIIGQGKIRKAIAKVRI